MTNECNVLLKVESEEKNKLNTLKLNNNNVKPQTIATDFFFKNRKCARTPKLGRATHLKLN